MSRPRVVLTDFIADDLAPERGVLGEVADIIALNAMTEAELLPAVETADAVIQYHIVNMSAATLDRMSCCKLLIRGGVGFDNVDAVHARSRGIPLANVPDYGTEEVADAAIGHMLALTRGINMANSRLRRGVGPWTHGLVAPLFRLRGRVFGIVGLGRIGTATALRAKALGMDIVFYDPFAPDGVDKALGVRRVERLEELCEQVYVLSLHCPLTPTTRHLIHADVVERMPKGSYLVNTSRGAVVDTTCLPAAIVSGRLAGAAIDVFAEEPPADDHPLIRAWRDPNHPAHDRVIVTPHTAFYSQEGLLDIRKKTAVACRRVLLGEPIRTIVN